VKEDAAMFLVNWEYRPAVILEDGRAFAILRKGGVWTEVDPTEVSDSGAVMPPERFAARFPEANILMIPGFPHDLGKGAPE
jgi:hypothetical protein